MNNGILKPARIAQFFFLAAVIAWCFSPVHTLGKEVGNFSMAQVADSIVAPNVFTPNGDGNNDVFEVVSKGNNTVSLKIFTRAGVLVFSSEAKRCRWDGLSLNGQEMANGIYYYTAEVLGLSPKVSKCGFLHLFR